MLRLALPKIMLQQKQGSCIQMLFYPDWSVLLSAENMAVWFLALTSAQIFSPEATHKVMSSGESRFALYGPSFTLPNQSEFLWLQCNRKELLGISSATLWFLSFQEFFTYRLSNLYSYQGRECGQVWGNTVSQSFIRNKCESWLLCSLNFWPYFSLCRLLIS